MPCRYSADPAYRPDLFLDMHAHANCRTHFLYCNPLPPDKLTDARAMDRTLSFPRACARRVPGFSLQACSWAEDTSKVGCARCVVGEPPPHCCSLHLLPVL